LRRSRMFYPVRGDALSAYPQPPSFLYFTAHWSRIRLVKPAGEQEAIVPEGSIDDQSPNTRS
ncbi:MAG: hypothetical protein RIC19_03445, partial [Phaeodactylibacter sp.]|uniref:hypothetical protein n=1 Tax=Phaeodactylibacter sp. TaxID=1940289 RepID=UPI0032F02289